MKHYGDITKLSGYELPIVDVITGGSPCQDLSVAGRRKGLQGERSGLFMEQVRITKEMRERDARDNGRAGKHIRPRMLVWENVPGAFSSNQGKDFQAVLTEIVRIVVPEAPDVPLPDKGGWPKSDAFFGVANDGTPFSVAYRLHDAQFWGVPQRRKRIALVADFGGLSAPEILFERESVSGHFEPGEAQREEASAGAGSGADSAICLQGNGIDRSDTAGCNGAGWRRGGVTPLTPSTDQPCTAGFKHKATAKAGGVGYEREKAPSLMAGQESAVIHKAAAVDCRNGTENECVNGTLQAKGSGGSCLNLNNVVRVKR